MQKIVVKVLLVTILELIGYLCADDRWRRDIDGRWNGIRTRLLFPRNFMSVRINIHGEKELRIAYNKVLAMETSMTSDISPEYDVIIRQVTNGRRVVNGVYQMGSLRQCDVSDDTGEIVDFVSTFASPTFYSWEEQFGDVFTSYENPHSPAKNVTLAYQFFKGTHFLRKYSDYVDMPFFRKECNNLLDIARSMVAEEVKSGHVVDYYDKYVEHADSDSEQNSTEDSNSAESAESDGNTSEHRLTKRSTAPVKKSRSKRSSFDFTGVLIFPGTKWCGKGDLAKCYEDLGDDQELDSCCRDHDCCPFVIPPFSTRFNIFNYRLYSLLHCDCDQRFRGCLQTSMSTMANMIGKIYFNVLGSKCFSLEMRDICVERSWYGRCKRYEKQETAVIRNQVSFLDAVAAAAAENQSGDDSSQSETS